MQKKKNYWLFIIIILIATIGISFSLVLVSITGTKKYIIESGNLRIILDESKTIADVVEGTKTVPVSDTVGKQTEGYYFSIKNEGAFPSQYSVYLDEDETTTMPIYALRFNLTEEVQGLDITANLEDRGPKGKRLLTSQIIPANTTYNYTLKIWLGTQAGNDAKNKTFSAKIRVDASQLNYYEPILNGTDPVLTDNLVPVNIANDGQVTKANVSEEWYKYEEQRWANAVVLVNNVDYQVGEIIPESNIESYFVWIPRYKYKIFNIGDYTGLTSLDASAVKEIEIEFETKDREVSIGGAIGSWRSHPAFQAFNSNGFWVGKFESGYSGATSTSAAQVNQAAPNKLIIKPNVYSWRNITVGNEFKTSYDYLREDESHMMKNTEWGAVAYLHHSKYGSMQSLRTNNNNAYITGYAAVNEPTCGYNKEVSTDCNQNGTDASVTLPYNTETGYLASTTANITGVYDMAGGAGEYVMGYTTAANTVGGNSGITTLYSDFFTNNEWEKYYDKYTVNSETAFNNRILGDATGELGPFASVKDPDNTSRPRTSWYGDYGRYVTASRPWFVRGGSWYYGVGAGAFAFDNEYGGSRSHGSFRVVLTP